LPSPAEKSPPPEFSAESIREAAAMINAAKRPVLYLGGGVINAFIQVLNPMNIAYRKREPDRVLATRMAIRTHRISYITLIAIIL
ncbi:hypothetical protein MJI47_28775, partial [Salmonella enterica subsp. enterica serovar Kentucky]|nr:hypothetical protein [Salmonella enterica subsp. enterica serovar Kentucky]